MAYQVNRFGAPATYLDRQRNARETTGLQPQTQTALTPQVPKAQAPQITAMPASTGQTAWQPGMPLRRYGMTGNETPAELINLQNAQTQRGLDTQAYGFSDPNRINAPTQPTAATATTQQYMNARPGGTSIYNAPSPTVPGGSFAGASPAGRPQAAPGGINIDWSRLGPSYSTSGSRGQSQNLGLSGSESTNYSGIGGPFRDRLLELTGGGPGSMPSLIDTWTSQSGAEPWRVRGEEIIDTMNQVANQRANQGILAGTEAENLRANMLWRLALSRLDKQSEQDRLGAQLKASTLPQLLGLAQESIGGSGSQSLSLGQNLSQSGSYSTSPDDYRLVADLIRMGYSG